MLPSETVTSRMTLLPVSAMKMLPFGSTKTSVGVLSAADVAFLVSPT